MHRIKNMADGFISNTRLFTNFNSSYISNKKIRIFEVGPRDGLQNEKLISTNLKVDLIKKLLERCAF